jgi:hypothetical protein
LPLVPANAKSDDAGTSEQNSQIRNMLGLVCAELADGIENPEL